ncbi:zincin-like metallopeptidase domain-containing protein [Acidithiobacillus sp.]|uniref:ArdC family protein n=1 Tax=Acidithiobacillus sp. TaxID=1872118 RepID=UPI0025BF15A7|nr:zincin-like metallopeptidase domain-containing protein [Acidithiobacillus sp.]
MPTQTHSTTTPTNREKRDVRQEVTNRIVAAVEENTAPWQRPYDGGPRSGPINAVTGKEYNGGNHVLLATVAPTGDPRWVTYKQAAEQGWQVKKGEHGIPIEVWKSYEKDIERSSGESPKFGGKEIAAAEKETRRFAKYYTVFHASQIDGIPPYEMDPSQTHDFDMHAVGEKLFDQNEKSAPILFDSPGQAFYSPKNDDIHLPPRESFLDAGHLYATAAHEIAHSTMAEHRLNRSRLQQFQNGTASDHTLRAKEELRAEMASYIISEKTGIPHHPENHESYVKGWISVLKNDKNEIYHAARDAEKMADYVIAQQKLLEVGQEKAIAAPTKENVMEPEVMQLNRGDLIQFRDESGHKITGIVLQDTNLDQQVRYKAVLPGPDGKPKIQAVGDSLAHLDQQSITSHLPNTVPGIGKLDMQSASRETDAARIPGVKAALEFRVASVMHQSTIQLEQDKQVHHRVILSHRKDLPDYVRQEPVDPDKPILEIQNHNRQSISGVLKNFEKDNLLLDTKEYGVVHVDIGKRFMEDGFSDSYLHKAMDKHIDVSLSNDGRILKIHNPELGPQPATDIFDTPAKPFGLMPFQQMDRSDAMQITGKLTHVHDTNLIEIQPAGKPMLISGRDPDKVHQAEIRAMVGHTVTVKPTRTGELKVEDRTPQKVNSLGR